MINTTTSFHQLKNMWNLSQILTDFEKSDNLKFEPNSHRFVKICENLAQIPQILSGDFGWRVLLWLKHRRKI